MAGGTFNAVSKKIHKHEQTPFVSSDRVCIRSCGLGKLSRHILTHSIYYLITNLFHFSLNLYIYCYYIYNRYTVLAVLLVDDVIMHCGQILRFRSTFGLIVVLF